MVDTTPPTVNSVGITSATTGIQNSFVNANDVVSVAATFSERVIVVSGTPTLTLVVGSTDRTATYASGSWTSGSGSTPLVFLYTIRAGDNDTNGISIRANVLALNSGTISDLAGNNATNLNHSAVSNNSSYMVDNTVPTVKSFTNSDALLTVGETMTVDLVFSEPALFSSADDINLDNANGLLTAMTSTDNTTWTGTFTPTDDTEVASNTLSLSSWTDLAGNNGPAADATPNYEVDTQAPSGSFSFTDYLFR
jgi:hypothetical protein